MSRWDEYVDSIEEALNRDAERFKQLVHSLVPDYEFPDIQDEKIVWVKGPQHLIPMVKR